MKLLKGIGIFIAGIVFLAVISSDEGNDIQPVVNELGTTEVTESKPITYDEVEAIESATAELEQIEEVKTEPERVETKEIVAPVTTSAKPVVTKPLAPEPQCHPNYSGCLKVNAGDYDCAGGSGNGPNYTGPVQVYGADPFDLDRDNDGWGCE